MLVGKRSGRKNTETKKFVNETLHVRKNGWTKTWQMKKKWIDIKCMVKINIDENMLRRKNKYTKNVRTKNCSYQEITKQKNEWTTKMCIRKKSVQKDARGKIADEHMFDENSPDENLS